MKQILGQVGRLKDDKIQVYKELHLNPWPEVLQTIKECNIQNYSIFIHGNLVFSYFEYIGENYAADMRKMEQDKVTQEWWAHTKPCFEQFAMSEDAQFHCNMDQIFNC